MAVFHFLLCLSFLALIFFSRMLSGFVSAWGLLFVPNHEKEVVSNKYKTTSLILTFFFTVPLSAFSFSVIFLQHADYWLVLSVMAGFILFRQTATAVLSWIACNKDFYTAMKYAGGSTVIVIALFSVVVTILYMAFPSLTVNFFVTVFFAGALISLSAYWIKSIKIFMNSDFSIVLWFLYLCSLEILPLFVAATVILSNGN
ncbi:MAG: DUF4271 domain-containing protein [Bacteroidales bacterium]|nr:DUF4271 domain-containing protein [Candidatus Cacconaster merdequi]